MAETDFLHGDHTTLGVKSYFFRTAPFGGAYAHMGGITHALWVIDNLRFDKPEFEAAMIDLGYCQGFVDYLKKCGGLKLKVWAPTEGQIIYPNEPAISVMGPLPHIRLVEGILTQCCNFATLSLTKWARFVRAARPGYGMDFSPRRAQNIIKSSLGAMLAGCKYTSNSEMRRFFDVLVIGTMGHEYVQRFGSAAGAFDAWLTHQPGRPVGLVDTVNCLKIDFPAWLDAVANHADAIKEADPAIWAWRNDSGDLAYLTLEQWNLFLDHPLSKDRWFRESARIVLTNDLDEHAVEDIVSQITTQGREAGFDVQEILSRIIWAAGTKPGTCADEPALGGVAKLMDVDGMACIKLALDAHGNIGIKTSIPGFNRSAVIRDDTGVRCVLIYPSGVYTVRDGKLHTDSGPVTTVVACHPDNPSAKMEISGHTASRQQTLEYDSWEGEGFTPDWDNPTIQEVADYVGKSEDELHWSHSRLRNPHIVKVSLTPDIFKLRRRMIEQSVLREDMLA
jgi:nicotinate phosphoribosyltransferase